MIKVLKLNILELVLLILSLLIPFMHPLKAMFPYLSYIDEFVVVLCCGAFLYSTVIARNRISKIEFKIIVFFLLFISVGIISNCTSEVLRPYISIMTDIFSYGKFIFVSIGGFYLFKNSKSAKFIYSETIKIVRIIVIIGAFLAVANQFIDFGMRDGSRYGIFCFKYVYDSAAILSWYCYTFMLLLTIDLLRGFSSYKIFVICLNMIMWICTARSRGFAFITIYLILFFVWRIKEKRNKEMKLHFEYIIALGMVALAVAWDQLVFYFTTATEARSILLHVGISLSMQFFPFGAGLGTFGTAAAQKYYSPVYSSYGIDNIYGFRSDNPLYLTDTFWPAVVGETGVIGLILYICLIFCIFKHFYKKLSINNLSRFLIIYVFITLICSSIATSVFAQNATIGDLFYLCMIPALLNRTKLHEQKHKY